MAKFTKEKAVSLVTYISEGFTLETAAKKINCTKAAISCSLHKYNMGYIKIKNELKNNKPISEIVEMFDFDGKENRKKECDLKKREEMKQIHQIYMVENRADKSDQEKMIELLTKIHEELVRFNTPFAKVSL